MNGARSRVWLDPQALNQNLRILHRQAPHLSLIPMIKANAYGHGSVWAAQAMQRDPQSGKLIAGWGVATFLEALELRQAKVTGRILVFSDAAPWTLDKMQLCQKFSFEPVLSELVSLLEFQKGLRRFPKVVGHVEVNTGMNRLGIPLDSLSLVRFQPGSFFTHLADAESPRSQLTQKQISNFESLVDWATAKFPRTPLHVANSATLWNARQFPILKKTQWARPGLALYGVRPFSSAPEKGLRRVMQFEVPVLNRIFLHPGDRVGYGGTYTCNSKSGEWIAILGGGYADGVFRSLSNRGIAMFGKKKLPFLGRVSMDLSAVRSTAQMKVGDWLSLWGNEIDPYEQSDLAGTIPYELTTRIGSRVERFEVGRKKA